MDTWMWCIYGAPLLIKRSSRGEIVVMVVGSAQQPRKWTMDGCSSCTYVELQLQFYLGL